MNYYPFHVGDYSAHTVHLEPMEDLAYRRMLDAYYLRESPLPTDPKEVARLIRMRQNLTEVEAVLHEFFEPTEDGWSHTRCDQEIERMRDKQTKARASAAASVSARKAKAQPTHSERLTNAERTFNEPSADVELPTPTPTPTPNNKEAKASPDLASARSAPAAPISEIVELYNKHLPILPQVTVVNDSRRRLISARWREVVTADKMDRQTGLEFFEWFFQHVGRSKFLTGKTKDWKANFEFLFNTTKFPRIVEGAYHQEQK